ncbi:hypothetical protein PHLGIDRAFT_119766 [Phlebiopsis gigantea 11061_1 CR5-6]|uniref:Uncharacterized protein n=1 Tax=Phlebiopsis gigantea (strain 11061_1 CR5-6) TaxID=745531 RepID=A0A0C3S5D0_PHLG1|nr:hypothetical protein PHLGIDRAFT_119766 [Phlebiopsis gigantea 11061_1 CR5-6]
MSDEQPMNIDRPSTPTSLATTYAPAAFRAPTPPADNAPSHYNLAEQFEDWTEDPDDNDDLEVVETEFLEREPRLQEIIRILKKRVKTANRERKTEEAAKWKGALATWERALLLQPLGSQIRPRRVPGTLVF